MHSIPVVQLRTSSAILYYERTCAGNTHKNSTYRHLKQYLSQQQNQQNPFINQKTYSGIVTKGAKKRIEKACSLLIQSTPTQRIFNPVINKNHDFKISFVTLTVSSSTIMLTAKEGHKLLLEPLLLWLRRVHGMRSYIWKAELQNRGQIHYHLTSDVFIEHTKLRDKWNELQRINGLLDDYKSAKGHYNPNSTDIHSVYKVNNLEGYLVKYMSKGGHRTKALERWIDKYKAKFNDGRESCVLPKNYFKHIINYRTEGKVWDCSMNLKANKYYSTATSGEIEENINLYIANNKATISHHDNFSLIKFNNVKPQNILSQNQQKQYYSYIKSIREWTKPVKQPEPKPSPEIIPKGKDKAPVQLIINYTTGYGNNYSSA